MVEDGWPLVGDGQWLSDIMQSSAVRCEVSGHLHEELKGGGKLPRHWPCRG
jgi:hypothetical protein